jgi:hypothetical protein
MTIAQTMKVTTAKSISHYGSQVTYNIGDFQKKFTTPK